MKSLSLVIALILLSVSLAARQHKCIHNQKQQPIQRIALKGSEDFTKGRHLQSFEPIRIHADYSNLNQGSTTLRNYIQKELMPSAIKYFSSALKVQRLTLPLAFSSKCDTLTPSNAVQQGVDADLVILVTAVSSDESYLAYAVPCAIQEPGNYRPIYGVVNFNLNYLPIDTVTDLEENYLTTLHEIVHILGFSSSLYQYYVEPGTTTKRNPLKTEQLNGIQTSYLDLEPLNTKLKTYFDCSTLDGAHLENEGSAGSAGSHFERRQFFNEFMTASSITDAVISEFTLDLLAGTGWYTVDYSMAEPFLWGKGKGCSFANGPCMNAGSPVAEPEFCPALESEGCSFTARAVAVCGTTEAKTPYNVPAVFNYWSNGTAVFDSFSDNCPYMIGFPNIDCAEPADKPFSILEQEVFGSESRCLEGTLADKATPNKKSGYCFRVECSKNDATYSLKVKIGSQTITCDSAGTKSVQNLAGDLFCPDPKDFCEKADPKRCVRGCSGRGTCNGVCVCPDGWGGTDCSLRSIKENCARCSHDPENSACYGDECCDPETCFASIFSFRGILSIVGVAILVSFF